MGNKGSKANAPVLRKEDLDALVKTSGMTEQEVDKNMFEIMLHQIFSLFRSRITLRTLSKNTRMEGSQSRTLVQWWQRFGYQHLFNGIVVYELFFQILPQADAAKLESHVFNVYDANGDGVIDFKEFLVNEIVKWHLCIFDYKTKTILQIILHMANGGSSEELLSKLFTSFDENK